MPYQDDVAQLKKGGFSDQDVQNFSDNQAVQLRQAGFSQDEVDSYQGVKPPASGTPPISGYVPTDEDFHNAAKATLGTDDHPLYQKVYDGIKDVFHKTGTTPAETADMAQKYPAVQDALEAGSAAAPWWKTAGTQFVRGAASDVVGAMQGTVVMGSGIGNLLDGDKVDNPEANWLYQKGTALQDYVNEHFPENKTAEQSDPIKMDIAQGVGSIAPLAATALVPGVGPQLAMLAMGTMGANSSYAEARQAGADISAASIHGLKMGGVWSALGIADVGALLKTVERTAPGTLPWVVTKAAQMAKAGVIFTGVNEFGAWLNSEIAKSADIPIEYKPTLRGIATEFSTGALIAGAVPNPLKEGIEGGKPEPKAQAKTSEAPTSPEKPVEPPTRDPDISKNLFPFYDRATDSFGLKNSKGEVIKTDFNNREEAMAAAPKLYQDRIDAETKYRAEYKPDPEEALDYKNKISEQAKAAGFNLSDAQLDNAVRVQAANDNIQKYRESTVSTGKPEATPTETAPVKLKDLPDEKGNQPLNLSDEKAAPTQAPTTLNTEAKLPSDLKNAKPRYGYGAKQYNVGFDSDVDKALYITAQKKPSKADARYRDFLKQNGFSDEQIKQGGKNVRDLLKTQAAAHPELGNTKKTSTLRVPKNGHTFLFQKGEHVPPESTEVLQPVLDYINKVAPRSNVEIKPDVIETPDGTIAHGSYDKVKNLITIALSSPDQLHTASHEALHAVRDVLTDGEWKTLTDEAAKQGLAEKYRIAERYDSNQDEETVAHWFADWTRDNAEVPPESKTIFEKLKDVFSGIAAKVRDVFGNASAQDIFNKIRSGEVGSREGEATPEEGTLYQKKELPSLKETRDGLLSLFSPTSQGELAKQTELTLRGSRGNSRMEQTRIKSSLDKFVRVAKELIKNDEDLNKWYHYVENVSKGAKLDLGNDQFQEMADTVRSIYQGYKAKIEAMPEPMVKGFIADYFPHMWKPGQEQKLKDFGDFLAQQGSARNLKSRVLPDIASGRRFGLELDEPNPIKTTIKYMVNMENFIAHTNELAVMKEDLGAGYYVEGKQPEGYTQVVGNANTKVVQPKANEATGAMEKAFVTKLYAPDAVANVYSVFYSKGFEDMKRVGPIYTYVRNAINTNTMMQLGLSGYHYSTIAIQSLGNDLGRIQKNVAVGDWRGVMDAIYKVINPVQNFITGNKILQQFKNGEAFPQYEQIAKIAAASNARIGQDTLSDISRHSGFYQLWKSGDLADTMTRLRSQMTEGYIVGGTAKSAVEVVQRLMNDFSYPLFNKVVPAMKFGAFNNLVMDWYRQNPNASAYEAQVNTTRIWDLIDSRFGEMNMENVFMNQKVKQVLSLRYRALGWDLGLLGQSGGAALDASKMIRDVLTPGPKFNSNNLDRITFISGMLMATAAAGIVTQYLYTGEGPKDAEDIFYPRTGGTTHTLHGNYAERVEIPGHVKEIEHLRPIVGQGWLSGLLDEEKNKRSSLPTAIGEAATNTDWQGKHIYQSNKPLTAYNNPVVAPLVHIAAGFIPFGAAQAVDRPQGSHIGFMHAIMGGKAAGARVIAPKQLGAYLDKNKH